MIWCVKIPTDEQFQEDITDCLEKTEMMNARKLYDVQMASHFIVAFLSGIQVLQAVDKVLEIMVDTGMMAMVMLKIFVLVVKLRVFCFMRNMMSKKTFENRSLDMQRFEMWIALEVLISCGIVVTCFTYTAARFFTRNRIILNYTNSS